MVTRMFIATVCVAALVLSGCGEVGETSRSNVGDDSAATSDSSDVELADGDVLDAVDDVKDKLDTAINTDADAPSDSAATEPAVPRTESATPADTASSEPDDTVRGSDPEPDTDVRLDTGNTAPPDAEYTSPGESDNAASDSDFQTLPGDHDAAGETDTGREPDTETVALETEASDTESELPAKSYFDMVWHREGCFQGEEIRRDFRCGGPEVSDSGFCYSAEADLCSGYRCIRVNDNVSEICPSCFNLEQCLEGCNGQCLPMETFMEIVIINE